VDDTPTIILAKADGEAFDWIRGYDPPPDNFLALLQRSLAGQDTFRSLSESYAKNPNDVETVFKLAKKYNDRNIVDKAIEKYKEVLVLDPEGKVGSYTIRRLSVSVPYVQYAEYALANLAMNRGMPGKPDFDPLKAFIKKYPEGRLAKMAYGSMANYYIYSTPKEEATPFFAGYTAKYPQDPSAWFAWLSRIVRDKENLDKGIEIAAKIRDLTDENPFPPYAQKIAEFYIIKGEKAKAKDAFGKAYMEGQASSLAYSLVGYANYWFQQDENKDSALEMAELAFRIYPENNYIRQQAAAAFSRMDKMDKALEIYGPDFVKKNADDAYPLRGYVRFWTNQGKNLEGALVAVQRLIVLAPNIMWTWDTASAVYLKLKKYDDAVKASEIALTLADADNKEYLKKKLDQVKAAIEKERAAEKY
jgi:tetratricopeptide (TPR) repeat protein